MRGDPCARFNEDDGRGGGHRIFCLSVVSLLLHIHTSDTDLQSRTDHNNDNSGDRGPPVHTGKLLDEEHTRTLVLRRGREHNEILRGTRCACSERRIVHDEG